MRRVLAISLICGLMLLPCIGASDSDKSPPKPQTEEPTQAPKQGKPKPAEKQKPKAEAKAKTKAESTPEPKTDAKAKNKTAAKPAAQKSKDSGKKPLTLIEQLESSDPTVVSDGIKAVSKSKNRQAVKTLVEQVRDGLPPDLLDDAIEALFAVNSPATFKELTRLADHRRTEVRVKVAEKLGETKKAAALKTLTKMLDDQQAPVRGKAAQGLGNINPQKAMKQLIVAAKHRVPEAAEVVGLKAKPQHVDKVLESLDEKSFEALAPIFSKVLERKNMPKKTKLKVIDKVAAVGADGAASLLVKYASSLGKQDPMRKQISDALKKYDDAQKDKESKPDSEEPKAETKEGEDVRGTGGEK